LKAKPKIRPVNPTVQPQVKTIPTNSASLAPLAAQKKGQEQQKKSWNKKWAALGATGAAATTYALQKEPVLCEGAKAPIDIETFDYASLKDMNYTEIKELIKSLPAWTWGYLFSGYNPRTDFCKKYLDYYIDNNKIEKINWLILCVLLEGLSHKQTNSEYSLKIINSYINNNKVEQLQFVTLDILFRMLNTEQKQEYSLKIINSFFDNNKIEQLHYLSLYKFFKRLNTEQRQEYSLKIFHNFLDNNNNEEPLKGYLSFPVVCKYIPAQKLKNVSFTLSYLLDFSEKECPTTQHGNKHYPQIFGNLELSYLQVPEIRELCIEMINYSGQEQEKGSVTFLHGQSWSWSFYETFYRKLEQQKGKDVSDDFMYFRYDKSSLISEDDATSLTKTGVEDYEEEQFGILFCNLTFMANTEGSNSIAYVASNRDQSTYFKGNENEQKIKILNLFKDSGLYEAAQEVYSSHKALFDKAEDLHKKASFYGNFVTICIPKNLVNTLIYPTESTGLQRTYTLTDGTETDDVLYMAEHADLLPFETEFAIVLGPKMTDPDKAKEAGIEIKQWNAANPEIIAQRDAIIDQIIQLVIEQA